MPERISYLQARFLLLLVGIGVAASQTILAHQRGAALTEVLAPALYVPVFAGAIFWLLAGGLIAAALASVIYVTLVADQIAGIGLGNFTLLAVTRVGTYFFFAVMVSAGVRYIENRLRKLEIYDQIDDLTGLYNSAFFLQDADLEASRSTRYRTLFSVVVLELPRSVFAGVGKRRYVRTIKDLAERLQASVRTVDRCARVDAGDKDILLAVLPETGAQGASVFAGRLQDSVTDLLRSRGLGVEEIAVSSVTYPDDPDSLARLTDEVAAADATRRSVSDRA